MTKERFLAAQALFEQACELEPSERTAWLDRNCSDPRIRDDVDRLLAQDERSFALEARAAEMREQLESGIHGLALDRLPAIAGYRLTEKIGEGGMGVVFRAEQERPERAVAVKVIRPGLLTESVLKRFDREAELLARLQHRGIAQVFEVGTFEVEAARLPFLSMEWIDGPSLCDYADTHDLSTTERLELLARTCDAVDHAHRREILHRDLKPANILVVDEDDGPQPKILDFGIARTMDASTDVVTLQTQQGEIVGTIAYMSPEQLDGDSSKLDRRCDVYALGVVAYELLTGALPIDVSGLSLLQAADVVRTREPTPLRSVEAKLAGDIETVVMHCLEKDPARRYPTAAALADDLRNVLRHHPIHARPPSAVYQLRKFARRNRATVAALSGISVALVAGLIATLLGLDAVRAERSRFDALARVRQFSELEAQIGDTYPAWPRKLTELRNWSDRWQELVDSLPATARGIEELRAAATQRPDAETVRKTLEQKTIQTRAELRARELADAVRRGQQPAPRSDPDRFEPEFVALGDEQPLPDRAQQIVRRAQLLVDFKRQTFGREVEGLGLARLALRKNPKNLGAYEAIAYGLHALGRDEDALATADRMVELTPEKRIYYFESVRDWVRRSVAKARSPIGALELEQMRRELRVAELENDRQHEVTLADESDQFLLESLTKLQVDVEEFEPQANGLRFRLNWAEHVEEWTIDRYRDRWERARRALAAADGKTASRDYAVAPIELTPQIGLIPIGMNPRTGFWEFYHLRSAIDPRLGLDPASVPIPEHDPETGAIDVADNTGIVFVLLPGGDFTMGAQSDDPSAPAYDPQAERDEYPPHTVSLAPFFVARHELTQGQWIRLGDGSNPSAYPPGHYDHGPGKCSTEAHPVEQINRDEAVRLLRRHGLLLPTEAQWDYAAHGGLDSPWSVPGGLENLRANVLDRTAKRFVRDWVGEVADFEDGYIAHAPVDALAPNPFGLYHVHGNVFELCRDDVVPYRVKARPGDGLRQYEAAPQQRLLAVIRGGNFVEGLRYSRTNSREMTGPDSRTHSMGCRAARALILAKPR